MRNAHYSTWSMARILKIMENEKHSVGYDMWRETLKNEKMRNTHCRTWNMARNLTIKLNEKLTWQDINNGQKH